MQNIANRQEAEIKLKQIFGLDHFYDEQWNAIERILRGERILMIERTGFGKSLRLLCEDYFFESRVVGTETLSISPFSSISPSTVEAVERLYEKAFSISF